MKVLEKVIDMCCADDTLVGKLGNKFGKKDDADEEPEIVEEKKSSAKPVVTKKVGKDGFTNKDVKFDDMVFAKLPLHIQKAAETLGFTEESWDGDGWPACEDKHWHDLTEEEKEAAEKMGWSVEAWDHKYKDTYWKDAPETVKKAAESMGWDQAMWDEDGWPEELMHKSWDDLTKQQKRAMNVFGYHKWAWD